jgi:hypothetical protein
MELLVVSGSIIAAALLVFILLIIRSTQNRDQIRRRFAPTLQANGLRISGDPLDQYQLNGTYEGIDLRLENAASAQPPWSNDPEETVSCARITFWVPLPHTVVCPRTMHDQVVVQFPPGALMKTRVAEFDQAFQVFVDPNRHPVEQQRNASSNLPWPPPETLGVLIDMNLCWLRIKDQSAEIVLPTIEDPRDVQRVLMLATTLAHTARGAPMSRRLPRGPLSPSPVQFNNAPLTILGIGFGMALLVAAPVGSMTLCFLPLVRRIIESDICGVGQRLLLSSSQYEDGTSYGLYCSGNPSASLSLMFFICAVASAACILAPSTLFALLMLLVRGTVRNSPPASSN